MAQRSWEACPHVRETDDIADDLDPRPWDSGSEHEDDEFDWGELGPEEARDELAQYILHCCTRCRCLLALFARWDSWHRELGRKGL